MNPGRGITKAEHDEHVERTGRPYTQGPRRRHVANVDPHVEMIPILPRKPQRTDRPRLIDACILTRDCPSTRHHEECRHDG